VRRPVGYLLAADLSVNGNHNCSDDARRLGGPCVSVLARLIVHIIGAPNVTPDLRSVATHLVATTHTLNAYTFSTSPRDPITL
jgi:hypothetical protein